MSCANPNFAVRLTPHPLSTTGKHVVKFFGKHADMDYAALCARYGKDAVIPIPCGKCSSCIESRTRNWAARCVLEASSYYNNSFITLTYSNRALPKFGLCKKDLQKFIRRLRKKHPDSVIRYYACGEYGSKTFRPHYHIIVFNYFPEDAKYLKEGDFGGCLYTSKEISELWPYGISSVGDVTYSSCGYVARYCQKKIYKEGLYKEFSLMSKKPGIGETYFREHYQDIYQQDAIYFDFGKSHKSGPIRYFDRLFEKIDPEKLEEIKKDRISKRDLSVANKMLIHGIKYYEELCKYDGVIKDKQFEFLKRKGDY